MALPRRIRWKSACVLYACANLMKMHAKMRKSVCCGTFDDRIQASWQADRRMMRRYVHMQQNTTRITYSICYVKCLSLSAANTFITVPAVLSRSARTLQPLDSITFSSARATCNSRQSHLCGTYSWNKCHNVVAT